MAEAPGSDEAAAIAAAVSRFEVETAAPPPQPASPVGPWQRAALLEGVAGKGTVEDAEGGHRWLS